MSDIESPVPAPDPSGGAPGISRAIYGMPMFATLLVSDLDATVSWYVEGLGFVSLFTLPGPGGPALVHLRRWQFQDLLVRPAPGAVTAGTGCTLSFAAVYDEIEALAARSRAHGGGSVDGPVDTPWNTVTSRPPTPTATSWCSPPPGYLAWRTRPSRGRSRTGAPSKASRTADARWTIG